MGSPQTAYTLNNRAGLPGMLYDKDDSSFIDSKPCGATALAAGVYVELVNGLLQVAQGTGDPDANNVWGLVLYSDSMEPNPTTNAGQYLPGVQVPILRRGRAFALLDAAVVSIVVGAAANFTHSSTGANSQGLFTTAANSSTAGHEISVTKAIWFKDTGLIAASPYSLAVIELNLP